MRCTLTFKKNYKWIWIAVDRFRKKYIDFVIGGRDSKTVQILYNELKDKQINTIYTDYYKSYESMLSKENHIQSKAETYTVEGYNSIFRHFLARMRRKTKCYSKCVKMLEYSIRLVMAKRNGELSIIS